MTTLTTDRLVLRPWHVGSEVDAAALFQYASNPKIGPSAGWQAHTSVAQSAQLIRTVLNAPETYAVVLKQTEAPIGCISLNPLGNIVSATDEEQQHALELGYWVGEPFWGRGLIPEASRELLRHGFEDLHLSAIWGTHDVSNLKSSRVMDKLGFEHIRVNAHAHFPLLGNVYRDEAIRRITREAWDAQHEIV